MLLENPSTYLAFEESDMDEVDFLSELARRTGCGLLLDVNNVFVSATNQNWDPRAYIDAFRSMRWARSISAAMTRTQDDHGAPLLIDSHGREVVDPVWALYAHTIARKPARARR
jgi:uncharacterized protein (UPF0276 family)